MSLGSLIVMSASMTLTRAMKKLRRVAAFLCPRLPGTTGIVCDRHFRRTRRDAKRFFRSHTEE